MLGNILFSCIFLAVQCRRYEIEQEAHKLYGDSLKSVLDKFRRTPEYLKILNDQMEQLSVSMTKIKERTMYIYAMKLHERVVAEMRGNLSASSAFRAGNPRMGKGYVKPAHAPRKGVRRSENWLDRYDEFYSPLYVDEKNRMKQLGFEYMGQAIHALMEYFTPDEALPMSTLQPHGGERPGKATTDNHHQHHHEVTQPTSSAEPATVSTHPTHPTHHSTATPDHHRNFRQPRVH